ncbi:MAG TPA: DsbA family oxidoreductase [Kofleriaceae bacterium]|nr:DsbA family oxidoreductase [Kofleriaceae bacterium]
MKIEIWADVICPWCGLGAHRLDRAVADAVADGAEIELVHRSFQLDPDAPEEVRPVREMLRARGYGEAQLKGTWERLESMAAAEGLAPYQLDNVTGNTRRAHELLAFAATRGLEDVAWRTMYRAYWGEKLPIFSIDDLVPIGERIGLPAADVRAALTEERHRDNVTSDLRAAAQLGIRGVPFVLLDRRLAVNGAQPLEVFAGAIAQAAARA